MERRLNGKEPFVPGYLGQKERIRQIADLIGVRAPRIFALKPIVPLLDSDLPAEFVLKPAFASTSIGVRLLRKEDDGFRDLVNNEFISYEELTSSSQEVSRRYFEGSDNGDFIVEQLLRGHSGQTPPPDVRAYCFQGEVGMILIEQHLSAPAEAMYFDGDFLPFADVRERYGVAKGQDHLERIVEARVPDNWKELLNIARRISTAMPTAFCRVDMYDTPDGVFLGEITFYPGTFITRTRKIMHQAEAERLGRMWDSAEESLAGSHEIKFGSQLRGYGF